MGFDFFGFLRSAKIPLSIACGFLFFHLVLQIAFVRLAFWAGSRILFYNGIMGLLFSMCLGASIYFFPPVKRVGSLAFLSLNVATACLVLVFFVVIPVTFDRSVSTFLLHTIENKQRHGEEVSVEELSNIFVEEYVVKQSAIERRMFEQHKSGNIEFLEGGVVKITPRGQNFLLLGNVFASVYGVQAPAVEKGR
jgi:hypothetical protein